jgi:acyl-CoA reductase-like NAD-dependent aldehyde dehydrogenase
MTVDAAMTIGGVRVTASDWITVHNPAHTDVVVGRYPHGTAEHAGRAVSASADALVDWSATPLKERAELVVTAGTILGERMGEWRELLTSENGKTLAESGIDFALAAMAMSATAERASLLEDTLIEDERRRLLVRKQPIGVCVGITPWNFPVVLSSIKIGPALMAGNTLVIKAPEFAPLATLEALNAVAEVFPPGVLNVVSGFGPEVGKALVQDPRVRKVSFTGSTETGKSVMADAAGHLARLTLELGGNDAAIVLEDVDITEEVIGRLVTGILTHTGQICFAIKRLYVQESRYDELVEGLRDAIDKVVVGDGARSEVTMGPINNERQYERVSRLLAETKRDLDCVQLGSFADGTDVDRGYFLLPHLVLDPPDGSAIVTCEQMGPIIPIMRFADDEEAVRRANDTEYGLASSVWSRDIDHAFAVAARVEAGVSFVNGHSLYTIDPDAPFGGVKHSGIGYQSADAGLHEWVQLHSITNNHF